MNLADEKDLESISQAGISLDANGRAHDDMGNPSRRTKASSSQPTEKQRFPFNAEDDAFLSKWVSRAVDQGLHISLKIFEDLESLNPRHTALSWQSRWRKNHAAAIRSGTAAIDLPPAEIEDDHLTSQTCPPIQTSCLGGDTAGLHTPVIPVSTPDARPLTDVPMLQEGVPTQPDPIKPHVTQGSKDCLEEPQWSLPEMPRYPAVESRSALGQIRALEWMSIDGRHRFEAQEAQLLSKWGVSSEHRGTCVQIPLVWYNLDPLDLLKTFDFKSFSKIGESRLVESSGVTCPADINADSEQVFSMLDHSTSWVRAGSWFRSSPHNGLELDNFLGSGPFRPMQGSHLCHIPWCINPHHVCYEDSRVNYERKRCHTTAQDLRDLGLPVPPSCGRHPDRPCLLQNAALTPFEALLIQFGILAQANGLQFQLPRTPPETHTHPTFETHLPVSFAGGIILDPAHLTVAIESIDNVLPHPRFYCNYCTAITTFRSLPGFWAHIRDGHPLVPEATRIADIIRAGRVWQTYKQQCLEQGGDIDYDDVTWKQAEQIKEDHFDWGVVQSWKLAYNRKRKFGKDGGELGEL